jgi:predicted Zn finger-like uncharacterized protein
MPTSQQCPKCDASLRVSSGTAAKTVKCLSCGTRFRVSADTDDASDDLAPPRRSRSRTRKSSVAGHLQPFLKRWAIACGIVLSLATLLGIGGLFSEPVAIAATVVCVVAILGCMFAGTVWMAVDLGKENVLLGVAVILLPVAGPALAYHKKGPALRGAIVFVSTLAPCALVGLMLLVFLPKYAPHGTQASRTAKWEDLMHQMDKHLRPDSPTVAVTLTVASRPGELDSLEPKCEALLRRFQSYVPGSLKIEAASRKISYQYRGSENFEMMIAYYLSNATGAFIPQTKVESAGPAIGKNDSGQAMPQSSSP